MGDNNKSAKIDSEVMKAISNCKVFACDLTYFNKNVLFELGFAIGKGKETLILLNDSVNGAQAHYENSFLKSYRYTPFINSGDIGSALQQHLFSSEISAAFLAQKPAELTDLMYIKSSKATEASIDLTEFVDEKRSSGTNVIIDDIAESTYKANEWYTRNILSASIILLDLIDDNLENSEEENGLKSFWAGFAVAQQKRVYITAPAKFKAPLDFHEIVIHYQNSSDLIDRINPLISNAFEDHKGSEATSDNQGSDLKLDLLKLAVGEGIAEQEKENLHHYFVETPEYRSALEKNKVLIVGRKGAGKTALHLKLIEEFSRDNNIFLITLKPEAHELLDDIKTAEIFTSKQSTRSFFLSLWKVVIFSKLLLSIKEHIDSRPNAFTESENKVSEFIRNNEDLIDSSIYGVMKNICPNNDSGIEPGTLESVYGSFLAPLSSVIREYFHEHGTKYQKIVLLADNLDKTWDYNYDLDLQTELILALFEVEGLMQKLLPSN